MKTFYHGAAAAARKWSWAWPLDMVLGRPDYRPPPGAGGRISKYTVYASLSTW
jgi:hypothetical protein